MAKLRFEIEGLPNDVAFSSYLGASRSLLDVLSELDAAISGQYRGSLQWYVSGLFSNDSLIIDLTSRLKPPTKQQEKRKELPPDKSHEVTSSLVTGFENLEQKGVSPPYLSEDGLRRVNKMFSVLEQNGARGYKATDVDAGRVANVSRKAAETLRELLPLTRRYVGSVEGRLETLSIHKHQRFIIYHARTKKAVTCRFDDYTMIPEIAAMFGKRVLASGMIQSNVKSEPSRVRVEDIRILGENVPTTDELTGSDPDFTGGMSTVDYVRHLRRG